MYTDIHMDISSINAVKTRKIQWYMLAKFTKYLAIEFQDDRITDFIL